MDKLTDLKTWLRGLAGAIIGGSANGVLAATLDPKTFNLSEGIPALAKFVVISGIISAALWLKQHPVPDDTK